MNKRTSFIESEFRAEEREGKLILEGCFIRYNSETNLFGDVYEEIDPKSVIKSLKENDIRALYNHDPNILLGRTGNNTVELESRSDGLWGLIEINKDDPDAVGAHARIVRGDVAGCSFGFIPLKEDYLKRSEGGEKIIIREMDLIEISPCVFPQYTQTEISARSKDIDALKKERFESRKKQLKERLLNE